MDIKKCETCKWLVLMSFCDGQTVDPSRHMCHYNWKECKAVRKEECKYKIIVYDHALSAEEIQAFELDEI